MFNNSLIVEYLLQKGIEKPENIEKNIATRVAALTGEAKDLALWLTNAHPEIPTNELQYPFYEGNKRHTAVIDLLKAVPEGKTFWETANYDSLWADFLPKKWENTVKNAWNKFGIYEKARTLYALATDWLLREIDAYEYLTYYNSIQSISGDFPYVPIAVKMVNDSDEKMVKLLKDILQNEAEIGTVNVAIIQIAMQSNRPDLWEIIVKLLLAAQRQEGLRQAIVNNIKNANVNAKILLLQAILDHELCRFASVLAAMKEYLLLPLADGLETNEKNIARLLTFAIKFLAQNTLLPSFGGAGGGHTGGGAFSENYTEIYMQLWALRQFNALKFWEQCEKLMQNPDPQIRALVCYSMIYIRPKGFDFVKKYCENETDIAVRWNIFKGLENNAGNEKYEKTDGTWQFFEKLVAEIPDKLSHAAPKFAWENYQFDAKWLFIHWAYRVARATQRSAELLPYQNRFDADLRSGIFCDHFRQFFWAKDLNKTEENFNPSEFDRIWIVNAMQDKSSTVFRAGFVVYNLLTPTESELAILLGLLSRKNDEIRKSVLPILAKLNDADLKTSISTLLASKKEEQRLAGLDLLQQLKLQNRFLDFVAESADLHQKNQKATGKSELIVTDLLDKTNVVYDESNGFGLYNPQNRAPIPVLEKPTKGFFAEKMYGKPMFGLSISLEELEIQIKKLDALFIEHENHEYEITNYEGNKEKILISNSSFQRTKSFSYNPSYTESLASLPLPEVWDSWYKNSKLTPLDINFLGQYTTSYPFTAGDIIPDWLRELVKNYTQSFTTSIFQTNRLGLKYPGHCQILIGCLYDEPTIKDQVFEVELDLTTHYFASIPTENLFEKMQLYSYMQEQSATWRDAFKAYFANFEQRQMSAEDWKETIAEKISDDQFKRFWAVIYWFYRMLPPNAIGFNCCKEGTLGRAYALGLVNYDEFCHLILSTEIWNNLTNHPRLDAQNTLKRYPIYQEFLAKAKPHFLNIELKRGETPTPVSKFVVNLSDVKGLDYLSKILKGLGKDALQRGYSYTSYLGEDKTMQFSRMLKSCTPPVSETFEDFKKVMDDLKITENRLVECALYAPQWLTWTEKYLGWKGFEAAAWCLHAHANNFFDLQKESELAKYTTVAAKDFEEGAVDIAWFKQVFADLGEQRFAVVYKSAHYISDNQGYVRARVYADAILGKLTLEDCKQRITDKRNKNYVVALGLIELDQKDPQKDVLERYIFIQNFKESGKSGGQQRRDSEKRVCELAMENLARNAGYADPMRLTWAMETLDVQNLLSSANVINKADVTISLQVNSLGKAEIVVTKAGKTLSDIPAALKSTPPVSDLILTKNSLNEQRKRIRKSLEEAMIRGDIFDGKEIENLLQHPIIKPLLGSLVLVSSENKTGFYADKTLKNVDGKVENLTEKTTFRIAHCTDLYASEQWSAYQKWAFQTQLVQPFKQIFRELYLPNADELAAVGVSKRYAGYQIQAQQAGGLFKSRGWSPNYTEGLQKVFHKDRIVATVEAYSDWYSPAYGTSTEVQAVRFRQKNSSQTIALKDVPKPIFSEIMRDLDLVVSIAHVGGVDIEASLSSIELRAVIVEETAVLLGLNNVKIEKNHVFIKGKKGDYTVHLGSGIAHKVPSVMLNISPVSMQARGRIFLPFVDEDPKTAEIVSKVILLAKDDEMVML
ncbi:MAG: hypothetical protein RL757_2509 [Bacteroidota bacterium]